MTKKAIGWLLSWALYWCGHAVGKLMHLPGLWSLYVPYNRLMGWSSDVQDWGGGAGPWVPVEG